MDLSSFYRLFQSNDQQFDLLLCDHVGLTLEMARLQQTLLREPEKATQLSGQLSQMEGRCDAFAKEVYTLLAQTFITRFDKTDLGRLTNELDNIADEIKDISGAVCDFAVTEIRDEAHQFAEYITEMLESLLEIVTALPHLGRTDITDHMEKISRLEKEADQLRRGALKSIFADQHPAKYMLVWRDLVERLEAATDHVKHATNVIATMKLKTQ